MGGRAARGAAEAHALAAGERCGRAVQPPARASQGRPRRPLAVLRTAWGPFGGAHARGAAQETAQAGGAALAGVPGERAARAVGRAQGVGWGGSHELAHAQDAQVRGGEAPAEP